MRYSIQNIKQKICPVLKEYGVVKAGIFGSYAIGKTHKQSDIDLLVEIKQKSGLIEFIKLKLELEKKTGKKVDLVEYKSINIISAIFFLSRQWPKAARNFSF